MKLRSFRIRNFRYYFSPELSNKVLNDFPTEFNLVKNGKASSSSHYKNRVPQNVLKGHRLGVDWTLNDKSGWFQVIWDKPIKGRYILLINRKSSRGRDPWGPAEIFLNDDKISELEYPFAGSSLLLIDLAKTNKIEKLFINIRGLTYPGLSGLEIYDDQ